MNCTPTDLLAHDTMVRELLRPLLRYLALPGATEIVVNRPQEVYIEVGATWQHHRSPDLTLDRLTALATAIATATEQEIGPHHPILSAMLPDGERVQIVLPPAVELGTISISIRRPSAWIKTLAEYETEGAFSNYVWAKAATLDHRAAQLDAIERQLVQYLTTRQLGRFIRAAVLAKKNIAVVGDTGSGKTTLMKSICQAVPEQERLITIEDVRELLLPQHGNRVHLLYAKGGQGAATITPSELIASTLRMKPDRVLLAELRGGEAFDFLKLLTTGHSGSITSYHAESCALAAERYVFMCKEHEQAATYDVPTLKRLVALTIDVILHVVAQNHYDEDGRPIKKERYVAEVHYDPIAKLVARFGEATPGEGVEEPMSRKSMRIAIALLLYLPLGLCGADALAGAVFTLANKRMPEDLSLSSWPDSWQAYREDPIQRKRLQFSAAVGGFVGFGLPALLVMSLTNQKKPLHGEARFASHDEIQQAGLYGERGVIVGKVGRRYLVYGGQEFVLLAAPTRSGKGVSIVLPNLLHYDESVVVLDIKMENFAYTSKFRQAHGHHVHLFNPFSTDGHTHRWNPLDAVDRDPNRRVGEIQAIGQVLYPTEQIKDAFWNESARNLFLGLTLSIMETPSLPCSLGEVLRQVSGKGQPIKDYLQEIISTRAKSDTPLSDDCTAALHRFCATSENTMASILATLTAPLTIFSNPLVDAATSATDFDLKQVRAQRMSIYVGIPANRLSDAALLVNLFFSQLIHYNTVDLPATNPRLKHQCLVILDEFPAIGRVNILAKAVGFMAGYNLRLLPIIQSLSQLESVYGEKDARTFVTNHSCQILFAPREQRDAQHYSQMLGTYTAEAISTGTSRPLGWSNGKQASSSSTHSEQARPLLLPQEVKELGDQRAIINLMHTKPILCDKARFYAEPVFIDRLKRISPSLASVGKRMPTQAELEEAAFVRRELSVEIPRLNLELHRAKVERRVRPVQPDEPIDISKLAMDLTTLPPVVSRDPPTQEDVNNLVDAFVAQLQWADKVDDDISEKKSPVSEEGRAQRTARNVDRSFADRDREERDV